MSEALGLHLCDDLIFASRVAGTAKLHGLAVHTARNAAALVELARRTPPNCVLLDLQNAGLDVPALLAELAEVCPRMPRLLAYGSHVAVEALKAARQAGCDPVMPRSKFVELLPAALPGWLLPT